MRYKNINFTDSQSQFCSRQFAVGVRVKSNCWIGNWVGEFQSWAATGFGRGSQPVLGIELYSCWVRKISFGGTRYRKRGTAVAQLLRCCATNRNVVGSIPDSVIAIFH